MLRTRFLFYFLVSSAALSFAPLTGCGSGSHTTPVSPAPFSVTSIAPASGTTQVSATATILIAFSSAADPATVNTTSIQVTDPGKVAGTVAYSATANTATYTPSAALAPDTTFTVTVTGVTSSSGAAMASPFTSTFATVPGSGPTPQYKASLLSYSNGATINGQVSVDTSGNVTVQLTGATASTAYTVQFCPAFDGGAGGSAPACIGVGSVSTDATGSGSSTAMFPQAGSWAGDFDVNSGVNTEYQTGLAESNSSLDSAEVYMSTLQPQTKVNGAGITTESPQVPLTTGTVTLSAGSIVFSLTGSSPNANCSTNESQTTDMDSSGTYALNSFTTNASGDASSTTMINGAGGDMFQVLPAGGAGYIGGFSVPQ
jgi:hypothetical protein